MATRLAEEWFSTCAGCEVSILDVGEPLLDVLSKLTIVHMPVIMDHKLFGQTGEKTEIEIPEAEVGLISGGIRSEEHVHLAKEMRKKTKVLIAFGSCACYGGIPALGNLSTTEEILEKVYHGSVTTDADGIPAKDIPVFTDRVYAISEIVPVDLKLPGCPPASDLFVDAVTALLEGKPFSLSGKSVCDECPFTREKKSTCALKRPLEPIAFSPGEPLSSVRCIMEQGYLCLGPVTKAGCGGHEKTPRCMKIYMPCRGCYGPVNETANPMVDMMGALSSVGLDVKEIPDRAATFNRFAGAEGRLRPAGGRGGNQP